MRSNFNSKNNAQEIVNRYYSTRSNFNSVDNSDTRLNYIPSNRSAKKNFMDYSLVKFFVYLLALVVFIVVIYAVTLPPRVSLAKFISSPYGLWSTLWTEIGRTTGTFLIFLLILWLLVEIKILTKTHKMEVFFLIAFVDTFIVSIFGEKKFGDNFMYFFVAEISVSTILIVFYDKFIYKNGKS